MFSSGTTGKPKCIVHSAGGVLLKHLVEVGLHSNAMRKKEIFLFYNMWLDDVELVGFFFNVKFHNLFV